MLWFDQETPLFCINNLPVKMNFKTSILKMEIPEHHTFKSYQFMVKIILKSVTYMYI